MSERALSDIQKHVEAALARHGSAGNVRTFGQHVSLVGHGPTITVEIGHLLDKWDTLPYSEKQLECAAVAKELSRQRKPALSAGRRPGPSPFKLLVGLGLLLAAAALYWKQAGSPPLLDALGDPEPAQPVAAAVAPVERDAEQARRERAERVCNATRTRVLRGATVGPTDVEGWVVELSLIREGGSAEWRGLERFVDERANDGNGRLVAEDSAALSKIEGFSTRIEVARQSLPADAPRFHQLRLTLYGGYVTPYFRERQRILLVRFANALARNQKVDFGALFARCESGATHHLGSWFLGRSPAQAAASLVYFMGAFAEPPQLPRTVLSTHGDVPLESAHALSQLIEATRHLDKRAVASLIGSQDGMVSAQERYATLRFPFVDSNRALRASRGVARAAKFE